MPRIYTAVSRMNLLRTLALVALVGGLTLLTTGCGSSPDTAVASLGATPTPTVSTSAPAASGRSGIVAFAACMRSHGVPNFPDPTSSGGAVLIKGNGIDPNSPQFQAAQQACRNLLPNGGQISPGQQAQFQQQALKFSACMRSHGVPNFPDPQFSGGGVRLGIGRNSGIGPNSPQFQAAQKACQKDLPGGRTISSGTGVSP